MKERKRRCKRGEDSDTDVAEDDEDRTVWEEREFLAEAMYNLINRTKADIEGYLKGIKTPAALADVVHDGLVAIWEKSVAILPRAGRAGAEE